MAGGNRSALAESAWRARGVGVALTRSDKREEEEERSGVQGERRKERFTRRWRGVGAWRALCGVDRCGPGDMVGGVGSLLPCKCVCATEIWRSILGQQQSLVTPSHA